MVLPDLSLFVALFAQQVLSFCCAAWVLGRLSLPCPVAGTHLSAKCCFVYGFVLSLLCIAGGWFDALSGGYGAGMPMSGSVLAGLLCGPLVGAVVGVIGGLCSYDGEIAGVAVAFLIPGCGIVAGAIHLLFIRRGWSGFLLDVPVAVLVAVVSMILSAVALFALTGLDSGNLQHAGGVAWPVVVINGCAVAGFVYVLSVCHRHVHPGFARIWGQARSIVAQVQDIPFRGLDSDSVDTLAVILRREMGVCGVCLTDHERFLSCAGNVPADFSVGSRVRDSSILDALEGHEPTASRTGALSVLVIPLYDGGKRSVGCLVLCASAVRSFQADGTALAELVGRLLSGLLASGRCEQQRHALTEAEDRLSRAQLDPHFLFNALNALAAVVRCNPDQARGLLLGLSAWFRRNLGRAGNSVCLGEELDHVAAYLAIEQARFADRLSVELLVPGDLREAILPAFVLQPLVENAVKHGIAQGFGPGVIRISAGQEGGCLVVSVEDNAGLCGELSPSANEGLGLGLGLVRQRLRAVYGTDGGLTLSCLPNRWTRATLSVPFSVRFPACVRETAA